MGLFGYFLVLIVVQSSFKFTFVCEFDQLNFFLLPFLCFISTLLNQQIETQILLFNYLHANEPIKKS